jgi:hypothetical protein
MMGSVSRKLFIASPKTMLMMLLHMKVIHMKTKEDGESIDQNKW